MSAVFDYPQRHAGSAQEYLRMGDAGVFAPDARQNSSINANDGRLT